MYVYIYIYSYRGAGGSRAGRPRASELRLRGGERALLRGCLLYMGFCISTVVHFEVCLGDRCRSKPRLRQVLATMFRSMPFGAVAKPPLRKPAHARARGERRQRGRDRGREAGRPRASVRLRGAEGRQGSRDKGIDNDITINVNNNNNNNSNI